MKKEKNMRLLSFKGLLIAVASVMLLGSCQNAEQERLAKENEQLHEQLMGTEKLVNGLMQTFSEVEDNLALIKEKEGLIAIDAENPEMKQRIVSDIQAINALMDENRNKIETLQQQLSKSGMKLASLDKKLKEAIARLDEKEKDLALLKDHLTARDFQIAQLNTTVDTLHRQVSEQTNEISAKAAVIENLDKALHKSYFTEGSFKELKEKGVIERESWTPWGGKKLELNANLSNEDFIEIDKRETTTIPINAKKVTIVSDHPQGTYELQKDDAGLIAGLQITNPEEFWKISNYLVLVK